MLLFWLRFAIPDTDIPDGERGPGGADHAKSGSGDGTETTCVDFNFWQKLLSHFFKGPHHTSHNVKIFYGGVFKYEVSFRSEVAAARGEQDV